MDGLYAGDSFFTLGMAARVGLVLVSAALGLGTLWLARIFFRGNLSFFSRAVGGVLIFWAFVWIAPQIHYFYYMLALGGLPLQWVIGGPPDTRFVVGLLRFSEAPSLSHHAQGAFGWLLIVYGLIWEFLPWLKRPRSRH